MLCPAAARGDRCIKQTLLDTDPPHAPLCEKHFYTDPFDFPRRNACITRRVAPYTVLNCREPFTMPDWCIGPGRPISILLFYVSVGIFRKASAVPRVKTFRRRRDTRAIRLHHTMENLMKRKQGGSEVSVRDLHQDQWLARMACANTSIEWCGGT